MRRSMLFLPGNTPNIIINGEILGADAVILDIEGRTVLHLYAVAGGKLASSVGTDDLRINAAG